MRLLVRSVIRCGECDIAMHPVGGARLPHLRLEQGMLVPSEYDVELWQNVCPSCGHNHITFAPSRPGDETTTASSV